MPRPRAKTRRRDKKPAPAPRKPAEPLPAGLMDMDEAIALLKTTRPTFYRWLRNGRVKGMKVGRQWRFHRDDLERFLHGEEPRIDLPANIDPLIEALQQRLTAAGVKDGDAPWGDEDSWAGDERVARAVRMMVRLAMAMRTSDLHIEPAAQEGGRRSVLLRYRIDGVLHTLAEADMRLLPALIAQWKRLAACNPAESTMPQDGRVFVNMQSADLRVDLRVCFIPTTLGETATIRIFVGLQSYTFDLEVLGYAPADLQRIKHALASRWGLVVCTGPAGCAKTTTLYSCLSSLASPARKIMTVEDPVEVILPGITQVQADPKANLTYARAVRSILRSAPDVIMVNEMRDEETLQACLQAALTANLVLTTMHSDTAAAALTRMVNMGAQAYTVSDATRLVIAQRLPRLLCRHCSRPGLPTRERLEEARERGRVGGINLDALAPQFRTPAGCDRCGQTGYRGRTIIAETLRVTDRIAAALRREDCTEQLLTAIAVEEGMTTLAADAIRRAAAGETSLEEALHVAPQS
jgi:general secretion pathway protein E